MSGFWRGRRVTVTGGAGFIGTNLVLALLQEGARVRVVDNLDRGAASLLVFAADVELHTGDLRTQEGCRLACQGVDVVFHLAARAGSSEFYRRYPADVLAQNLLIDANMLESARALGVERYFYASTVFVYPASLQKQAEAPPLREEQAYPADPPLSYGWAKLMGERGVEYACQQGGSFSAAVFRMMNPYGPHQDFDLERGSIIPVLLRRAVEYPAQPFSLRTTGEETRSFCYVGDVVEAMLRSMEKLGDGGRLIGPLNVGSEESIRMIDLAERIATLSGKGMTLRCGEERAPVQGQAIDCTRARAALDGWTPVTPLEEGLAETLAYIESALRVSHAQS